MGRFLYSTTENTENSEGFEEVHEVVTTNQKKQASSDDPRKNLADFYVIVHADDSSTMKESLKVAQEIQRIRREEQYAEVQDNPAKVDFELPLHRKLLVCGFYHGQESWDDRCVDLQIKALRKKGYNPELYMPATISLKP